MSFLAVASVPMAPAPQRELEEDNPGVLSEPAAGEGALGSVSPLLKMAEDLLILAFLVSFLRMKKSFIKAYFSWENLGSCERGHPELGLDIFFDFFTVKTFLSIKPLKTTRAFCSLAMLIRVKEMGS